MPPRSRIPWLLLLLPVLGLAVLLLAVTHLTPTPYETKSFRINAGAMVPTLLPGDYIAVIMRPVSRPRHGALLVFESVEEQNLTILMRVIATPGDTVAMDSGQLQLNGAVVTEPYLNPRRGSRPDDLAEQARMADWQEPFLLQREPGYAPDRNNWGPLLVPRGAVLVLGDNRDLSYDSRFWGFLPIDHIRGAPSRIYYSYDPDSYRLLPRLLAIRWKRIGLRFPEPD